MKKQKNTLKTKELALKQQELALKAKDQIIKKYQKALQQNEQEINEITKVLEQQLKMAQEIYHTLMPSKLPVIPGCAFSFKFHPAQQEGQGKDFYEISPHPRYKSFSLTLSSSQSHSLSALLFSARLKMMSQMTTGQPLKPKEFLNQMQKELNKTCFEQRKGKGKGATFETFSPYKVDKKQENAHKTSKKPRASSTVSFVQGANLEKISLFYGLINQKTYQLVYALTGDIVALLYCAERGKIKQLNQELSNKISLNGRDKLIVLSPGVFQTRSLKGQPYALSKIKKILKEKKDADVHEIRNQIFYDLKAFSKGQPSKRDQSVLVMEVKQRILKLTTLD